MTHEQIIELELAQIGFALAILLKIAANSAPNMMMSDRASLSHEGSVIIRKLNKVLNEIEKSEDQTAGAKEKESEVEK